MAVFYSNFNVPYYLVPMRPVIKLGVRWGRRVLRGTPSEVKIID